MENSRSWMYRPLDENGAALLHKIKEENLLFHSHFLNIQFKGIMARGRATKRGYARGASSSRVNMSETRNPMSHDLTDTRTSISRAPVIPTHSSPPPPPPPPPPPNTTSTIHGDQEGIGSGNALDEHVVNDLGEQSRTPPNRRGINLLDEIPENPDRRILITIENDYFQPKEVSRTLGALCKSYVTGPWTTWKQVEPDTKYNMWIEFEARHKWNDDTTYVKRIFNERCKIHWATTMYNGRKDQLKFLNTNDISKLKGKNPNWCHIDIWDPLVYKWCKEEWKNKSNKASMNRRTIKYGSMAKHTCGSMPISAHKKILEVELGRKANPLEIFKYTHTKRQKGETSNNCLAPREFIDGKSHAIHDSYFEKVNEKFGTNTESHPTFDRDSWDETTGGFTKGRLYGFGKGDSALFLVGAKTLSSNGSTQENEIAMLRMKEDLEAKFEEQVEAIEVERRKEMEEMEAQRQKDKDEMEAKFESMRKMMFDMLRK